MSCMRASMRFGWSLMMVFLAAAGCTLDDPPEEKQDAVPIVGKKGPKKKLTVAKSAAPPPEDPFPTAPKEWDPDTQTAFVKTASPPAPEGFDAMAACRAAPEIIAELGKIQNASWTQGVNEEREEYVDRRSLQLEGFGLFADQGGLREIKVPYRGKRIPDNPPYYFAIAGSAAYPTRKVYSLFCKIAEQGPQQGYAPGLTGARLHADYMPSKEARAAKQFEFLLASDHLVPYDQIYVAEFRRTPLSRKGLDKYRSGFTSKNLKEAWLWNPEEAGEGVPVLVEVRAETGKNDLPREDPSWYEYILFDSISGRRIAQIEPDSTQHVIDQLPANGAAYVEVPGMDPHFFLLRGVRGYRDTCSSGAMLYRMAEREVPLVLVKVEDCDI